MLSYRRFQNIWPHMGLALVHSYIADSALITKKNLEAIGEDILFVSRLPATYKECDRASKEAVAKDAWEDAEAAEMYLGQHPAPTIKSMPGLKKSRSMAKADPERTVFRKSEKCVIGFQRI